MYCLAYTADDDSWIYVVETSGFEIYSGFIFPPYALSCSRYSGKQLNINDAPVVPQFSDDENTLPHAVNVSGLVCFEGVYIPAVPERRRDDILIGQCDEALLTVLDERESMDPENPSYVLTKLGSIASGKKLVKFQTRLIKYLRWKWKLMHL